MTHADPACAGAWHRLWTSPTQSHWRYGDCGMVYYDAPDVARAAAREARLGRLLRTLTRQGRRFLGEAGAS